MQPLILAICLPLAIMVLFILQAKRHCKSAKDLDAYQRYKRLEDLATLDDKCRRANRELRRAVKQRYGLDIEHFVTDAEYNALIDMVS